MGRAQRRTEYDQQPGETRIEHVMRLARMKANARSKEDPIVPVEAEAHGDYRNDFVTHVETGTKAYTKLNRGGSPVDRWMALGKLTEPQWAVIQWCYHLWDKVGLKQRTTANYGERIAGTGSSEWANLTQIEAKEDLYRIMDYFPGAARTYWAIFEDVCRFDVPAGVAGGTLGYGSRSADTRAHQIVCFVADIIASRERIA
jgi:hypothetical protein